MILALHTIDELATFPEGMPNRSKHFTTDGHLLRFGRRFGY